MSSNINNYQSISIIQEREDEEVEEEYYHDEEEKVPVKTKNTLCSFNIIHKKLKCHHLHFHHSQNQQQCKFSPSTFFSISTLIFGLVFGYSIANYSNNRVGNSNKSINQNNHNFMVRTATTSSSASSSSINFGMSTNHNNVNEWNQIQNGIYRFMNDFIYNKNNDKEQQILSNPPLLRFPFPGSGSSATPPRPLIYFNSPNAYALLIDSLSGGGSNNLATMSVDSIDFFLLSSGLDVQLNTAYCGPASIVALLNSLRFLKSSTNDDGVDMPIDPVYAPYPYATQVDIFNECTQKTVISHTGGGPGVDGILTPPFGLSMPQVADALRCHLNTTTTDSDIGSWSVTEQYVDTSHITIGKVRFDLKTALADPNSRVLVNYDRSVLGQNGTGHWSPVGSYSDSHDAFLILDVAKYKYPPVWVPTERLFDSMATYDNCGSWNFPDGQNVLSREERTSQTIESYAAVMTKLGCKKMLRGYITVTRTS